MCNEWQPIESAPKDGTTVILSGNDPKPWVTTGFFSGERWCPIGEDYPILDGHPLRGVNHWMPMPAPPKETE